MKDSSTNPKIQAFRRELEEIALKHLGNVPENNTTSTSSVNTGSQNMNEGDWHLMGPTEKKECKEEVERNKPRCGGPRVHTGRKEY
ncbi:hypothetical protein Tco_0677062 [Tanacetum coccineum]